MDKKTIERFAAEIRLTTLEELAALGFGHVGGCMSMVETLAVLYGKAMKTDPKNPKWEDRDYFILSKGHAGPALYATLALKGYFDKEVLKTLNMGGTILPSHADMNLTPGVDMTTGSLGQGLSAGVGMALSLKMDKKDNRVYVMMGDGELDEGQNWEAVMSAAQFKTDNLISLVDYNKEQLDGSIEEIKNLGDIARKFEDFGWNAYDVDGHDIDAIYEAVEKAKVSKDKPSVIVLNTEKGKGCTYAKGVWNHFMAFTKEQSEEAIAAAKKALASI